MYSIPRTFCTRFWALLCGIVLCGIVVIGGTPAVAQNFQSGEGVVRLTDWPSAEERNARNYEILPFLEFATVAYEYRADQRGPMLSLSLEWTPERDAVYQGRRVRFSDIPGDVRMVAVDLRAGVFVDGRRAATLTVVVDSMLTGPSPDFVDIDLPDLTWENVFSETPSEVAKTIFLNGFELKDLEIASAAFAVFGEEVASNRPTVRRPDPPTRVSVYRAPHAAEVLFDVYWLIGRTAAPRLASGAPRKALGRGSLDENRRSRNAGDRSARTDERRVRSGDRSTRTDDHSARTDDRRTRTADRGSRSGDRGTRSADYEDTGARSSGERNGEGRGTTSSTGDDDGERSRNDGGFQLPTSSDRDDDDDDDDKLVPYALAAVGAAGLLAAVGGTIGYYGSSRHAPLGLSSGLVRREGGLLLQVGVNDALLLDEPGPKRLMVKLLSFGNILNSDLQPAVGGGVLATSAEGREITYEPSVSVGAVGRYKMLLFYGGFDVIQGGPEFGIALNVRQLGLWKGKDAD